MKSALAATALLAFLCSPGLAQNAGPEKSSQMDAASGKNDPAGAGGPRTKDKPRIQMLSNDRTYRTPVLPT